MGMSFAYFIIEVKFFVTEKSCYGAVYQVLMMHDLDLLLVLLIDLLQSFFIDLLLVLVHFYYYYYYWIHTNRHFGNKSSILCHTIMLKWKNKKEKRRNAYMINLFLTTYYLIDYFFYKWNIFYQSQKFRVGICNGNQYFRQGLFASNWNWN